MHCIFCVNNTFFLYGDNKSNCYYKEEHKNIINNSCIETCKYDYIVYNDMFIPKINEKILSDFKNKILSNINSYMNTTHFINGTNFIGIALSSNNMVHKSKEKWYFTC